MINLNSGYRGNLKYWLTFVLGLIGVLAIMAVGSFYVAKPYLDSFIRREIARHSIKAETSEVSILGKVNLTNVTLKVPSGTSLKIGAISARPPIFFIPGTFTLYNVDLKYNDKHNDIHVNIPRISLNRVSLKEKDTTITSRLLQLIMRIELSSIVAPNIQLFADNTNGLVEKFEIKNFQLSDFKNGRIRSVGIKNIDLKTTVIDGDKQIHMIAKSDVIKAHDIDINYACNVLLGKANSVNQVKNITGPISLNNVVIGVFKGNENNVSLSLGAFKTAGFKVNPPKQIPRKLFNAYLGAREKNTLRDTIINGLFDITLDDAEVNNLTVDTPRFKETLDSFQFKQSLWKYPIPKKLLISFNNLSILPKKVKEKDLELFKKIGIEHFDFSKKLDISYDEKKHTLSLNTMSFNIKNVGSGEISAKIVNVDEKLFSAQKDLMIAASQDVSVMDVGVRYTDAGFIDKLFSYLTLNLNDTKHDLKKELYDNFYLIMTQSPKILLKDHDEAENISKSLGDFAKNPKTLTIKIKAIDNKGLTITDLEKALQNDLSTVLNKVHLTIKNEALP
ncbi:hypothetical protein V4B17_00965 [Bartonella sp. B23]